MAEHEPDAMAGTRSPRLAPPRAGGRAHLQMITNGRNLQRPSLDGGSLELFDPSDAWPAAVNSSMANDRNPPGLSCQKCRTPIDIDASIDQLNPAAFKLLTGVFSKPCVANPAE